MRRRTANVIMLGAFALTCIGGMELLAVNVGQPVPLAATAYSLTATFPDASGLAVGADVRMSGVSVGKVTDIRGDSSGGRTTVVALSITDASVLPVYSNGSAVIRAKSLLGDEYVDVVAGNAGGEPLASGATLPIAAGGADVSNDQIFNAFDATTRTQEQQVLQALDKATAGHQGDLRSTLADLRDVFAALDPVATVYGRDRAQMDAILRNLDTILQATADEHDQVAGLLANGSAVLNTVAARDQALVTTLREAGAVAAEINTAAAPTIDAQRQTLAQLAPSLTSLNQLLGLIVEPQPECGNRPCGIDELISETFTGNINYPNDQLNITSSSGNAVANEWASMFSMPATAEQSHGATHSALNLVLSEHCDSVKTTLQQLLPQLPAIEQTFVAQTCGLATGSQTPPAFPTLPHLLPQIPLLIPLSTSGPSS